MKLTEVIKIYNDKGFGQAQLHGEGMQPGTVCRYALAYLINNWDCNFDSLEKQPQLLQDKVKKVINGTKVF